MVFPWGSHPVVAFRGFERTGWSTQTATTLHRTPKQAPEAAPAPAPCPLQAPGRPSAKHRAHNDPQVVTDYLHQVALGHLEQTTQPTPPTAARLADVGEGPLDVLTATPLQPLTPSPTDATAVVPVSLLPGRRFIDPDPLLAALSFGDVGPHPGGRAGRQGLGL